MKKNKLKRGVMSVLMAIMVMFSATFTGCDLFGKEDVSYSIMYSDGNTIHTITVKKGDLWQMDMPLPQKEGYSFAGLYDAETGGTQYATALGMCVTAFNEKRNITLFPQFKQKEYTLDLRYEGAYSSGSNYSIIEGEEFPYLPSDLSIANNPNMIFQGWFTQKECQGLQVTDNYGHSLISVSQLLETVGRDSNTIILYAGFDLQACNITYYAEDGSSVLYTNSVKYGSKFSDIMPFVQYNEYVVREWSTQMGGEVFNGEITSDLSLYAITYSRIATVTLDFNCKEYQSQTQKVPNDSPITLPLPNRAGFVFVGWYLGNKLIQDSFIPQEDTTLVAKWKQCETYTIDLDRKNCKVGNGYNPEATGTDIDILAHGDWNLVSLALSGCVKNDAGKYVAVNNNEMNLSIRVLQNLDHLPTSNLNGASVNWTVHHIENSTFSGAVKGTNINGSRIGKGAYYIKITYSDNSLKEINKVNFLSGASANDLIAVPLSLDLTKKVVSMQIVVVYELWYDYMNSIWNWGGTKDFTNWRAEKNIYFA